jgi:hypothetical protein
MVNVSHHLVALSRAGLLVAAKEGRHVYDAPNPEVYDPAGDSLGRDGLRVRLPKGD